MTDSPEVLSEREIAEIEKRMAAFFHPRSGYARPILFNEFVSLFHSLRQARAALEPFAKAADCYEPDEGDGSHPNWDDGDGVTVGALRRARTVLGRESDV